MTLKRIVVFAAALLTCAIPLQAQNPRKLDISFNAGRVTLVAEGVTLAEIFREWARKGGSTIVNAERLPGAPVLPTEFRDQPEAEVLRALLDEAPGYGASMRIAPSATASTVQTVFILAVRATTPSASASAPMSQPIQQVNSPVAAPRNIQGSPDDEIPPVRPLTPDMNPGAPATPSSPAGQPTNPNLRQGPGGIVTSTVPGVPIPGPTPTPKPGTPGRGGGGGSR